MTVRTQLPTPEELMLTMKSRIDEELANYMDFKVNETPDPFVKTIVQMIREFTISGGKRIRPILVVAGYSLFGDPDEKIYKAALSMEISQTYFLIQDDVMDRSPTRRGRPSFHVRVNNDLYAGRSEMQHEAESVSIIASDLADAYCHEILLSSGFSPELSAKADLELSKIFETTGFGQLVDIRSASDDSFSSNDLIRLHLWKTARYTIQGPLSLGAILSGTSEDLNDLSEFGFLVGLAFQIQDDILGLFGEESVLGKSVKSDVNEGKKTMLMLKAMELASAKDSDFIWGALKSGNVSDSDFNRLREIVKTSGSLEYSEKLCGDLVKKSKEHLSRIKGKPEIVEFLSWLSDYIITRKS